jgi:hypothetical protein
MLNYTMFERWAAMPPAARRIMRHDWIMMIHKKPITAE